MAVYREVGLSFDGRLNIDKSTCKCLQLHYKAQSFCTEEADDDW